MNAEFVLLGGAVMLMVAPLGPNVFVKKFSRKKHKEPVAVPDEDLDDLKELLEGLENHTGRR